MITRAEVEKLATVHAVEPTVLSLYLVVPLDPAQPRELAARADDLIATASHPAGGGVAEADRVAVRAQLTSHGRDWPGHTVAVFACADAGLFEVVLLPGELPERAVIGTRAHIRPLLAVLLRAPAHRVAVVDRRHAWLFAVTGDEIETVTLPGDTAAVLEDIMRRGGPEPLVIGGRDDSIGQLLARLRPLARAAFAGSFTADPHTLTPARVAGLAAPVVARWAEQHAQSLAAGIREMPPGLAATGVPACLAAVNARAVDLLAVPDGGLVPGYLCLRCGALSSVADGCPDWGTAAQPIPDLIEEMVTRTLDDSGQVCVIRDPAHIVMARLRFPVVQA